MASPQKENGYTAIANEILEHLSFPGMNGSEFRVTLFVIRKTYGFHKKSDRISLTQFEKGTHMNRAQAVATIKTLLEKKILTRGEDGYYKLNKNWEEWVVSKRGGMQKHTSMQKHTIASMQKHTKSSMQKHTHKRKKETITKDIPSATQTDFIFEDYLKDMDDHHDRAIQIIAFFFKEKKLVFDTYAKVRVAIKRHLRAARQLVPFTDEEISKAVMTAKAEYPDVWTTDTLVKIVTK